MLGYVIFVRGGIVYPYSQQISYAGEWGDYWSSRVNTSNAIYAYSLFFTTSVDSSSNNARHYGFSLRCLIPTT